MAHARASLVLQTFKHFLRHGFMWIEKKFCGVLFYLHCRQVPGKPGTAMWHGFK